MDDPNTICVVIPAYNAGLFLADTVASVQASRDVNVRIVIVDDGSQDDTGAVALRLQATHANVVLISQANGGVSAARNAGVSAAGRYVCFLDADDLLEPDGLRNLLLALQMTDGAVAAYGRVGYLMSETGERRQPSNSPVRQSGDISASVLCGNLIDTPGAVLFCTEAVLQVGGFLSSLRIGEDWNLYARVAQLGKVLFVDRIVMWYRLHEGSVMSRARLSVNDFQPALNATYNCSLIESKHSRSVISRSRLKREIELGAYMFQRSRSLNDLLMSIREIIFSDGFLSIRALLHLSFWRMLGSALRAFWRLLY